MIALPSRLGAALLRVAAISACASTLGASAASAANFSTLYKFGGGTDAWASISGLATDAVGDLYGTTIAGGIGGCYYSDNDLLARGCGTAFKLTQPAVAGTHWSEALLWQFNQGSTEPYQPRGGFAVTASGPLIGTSPNGGVNGNGALYELSPPLAGQASWTNTIIYSFIGLPDGAGPFGQLITGPSGTYYGATSDLGPLGGGTVFQLTPPANSGGSWSLQTLYSFEVSSDHNGYSPRGALVTDASGAIFGTTFNGGKQRTGTVFKLRPPEPGSAVWREGILHHFTGSSTTGVSDGANPTAGVVIDKHGNVFGTTTVGGLTANCPFSPVGCGIVYELSPPPAGTADWTETIIYQFQGGDGDGANPFGGLIFDRAGNLYGTTESGGLHGCNHSQGCGTLFKLSPPAAGQTQWSETVLHFFTGTDDGGEPQATLIRGRNHELYGTTAGSLNNSFGTVFRFKP